MSQASNHPHRATLPPPGAGVRPNRQSCELRQASMRDADGSRSRDHSDARGCATPGGGGVGASGRSSIVAYNSAGVLSRRSTSQVKPCIPATSGTPGWVNDRPAATRIPISREGCPARAGAHAPRRAGTRSAYVTYGCRCPDARQAYLRYQKKHRVGIKTPALVDATGTMRRLQAMACLGYPPKTFEMKDFVAGSHIHRIRNGDVARVSVRLRDHVATVCHEKCDKPLPPTSSTNQVYNLAKRKGWLPFSAWENIDDPSCDPETDIVSDSGESSVNEQDVDLAALIDGRSTMNVNAPKIEPKLQQARRNRLNRRAIQILFERGCDLKEIADRIGLVHRQVQRHWAWIQEHQSDVAETTLSATSEDEAPAA